MTRLTVMIRRIVLSLLLVVAVGLFALAGRNGKSGDEPEVSDAAVEALIPGDGSPNVLRQAEIGIDLATGWTADLAINGRTIPEDQLRRNEPLNQVFFTPGPGKEIEKLAAGEVIVVATIWKPTEGETRADARQVVWRFRTI
jgi:hypothetical protein